MRHYDLKCLTSIIFQCCIPWSMSKKTRKSKHTAHVYSSVSVLLAEGVSFLENSLLSTDKKVNIWAHIHFQKKNYRLFFTCRTQIVHECFSHFIGIWASVLILIIDCFIHATFGIFKSLLHKIMSFLIRNSLLLKSNESQSSFWVLSNLVIAGLCHH